MNGAQPCAAELAESAGEDVRTLARLYQLQNKMDAVGQARRTVDPSLPCSTMRVGSVNLHLSRPVATANWSLPTCECCLLGRAKGRHNFT
jgi:hypothetical protein